MSRARSKIVGVAVVVVLSACSSGDGDPGAAEPAKAPPTTTAPAGTVRHVGALPQGIVYDSATNLVAVAVHDPARLLLLDPTTLGVKRSVALPGTARHLQLGAGGRSVLVPAESANALVDVALPGGTTRRYPVRKQPHDAAQTSNGDIAVGDEFGKSISLIRDGQVTTIRGLTQPGGVIATGPAEVAAVDVGAFTVSTYDLTTAKRIAVAKAGAGPTHGMLVGTNRILVSDTRGNALLEFSVSPLREVGRLSVSGTPYGLAADPDTHTVWVTLTARNEVAGFDVSGDTPRRIATYPTVRQPDTVAVAPGSHRIWVTGTTAGVVQLITR